MKYFKPILILLVVFGIVAFLTPVLADYGLEETAGQAGLLNKYPTDLPTLAGNVVGTGLSMIAVLFFGLMIYGGILWMTARGNEETTKKALNTIVAAIIGMIIVLASYAITSFVFKSLDGSASSSPQQKNLCAERYSGWACLDISQGQCEFDGEYDDCNDSDATDNTTITCKKDLCEGGTNIVCCKPKTAGSESCKKKDSKSEADLSDLCVELEGPACGAGTSKNYCVGNKKCKVVEDKNLSDYCSSIKNKDGCTLGVAKPYCDWK